MSVQIKNGTTFEPVAEINAVVEFPVGYVYTVLPGKKTPVQMSLAGTWVNISSQFAGLFEGIEGGDRKAFNTGAQADQMQGHWHKLEFDSGSSASGSYSRFRTGTGESDMATVKEPISDGTNGTPRVGSKTYPENITVQKWERTA